MFGRRCNSRWSVWGLLQHPARNLEAIELIACAFAHSFRLQQMERFKALEKEMKTKAFSKEGLIQAAKLDPAEKAKMDTINWLSSMIDELARQVEASEAEIEVLAASSGKKRGKGPGGERIVELETLNERRKWHVGRMELIQRMVDNGGISVETVDGTKEDISYFVESNQVRHRSLSHLVRLTSARH